MSDGSVAIGSKMLTYWRVSSAFDANRALPANMIWEFVTVL
jgi:hypothetical protein